MMLNKGRSTGLTGPNWTITQIANSLQVFERMAGTTRLELATSAVTGQRSNQLNYVPTLKRNAGLVGSAGLEPATSCL
jgi:hypothetical protein